MLANVFNTLKQIAGKNKSKNKLSPNTIKKIQQAQQQAGINTPSKPTPNTPSSLESITALLNKIAEINNKSNNTLSRAILKKIQDTLPKHGINQSSKLLNKNALTLLIISLLLQATRTAAKYTCLANPQPEFNNTALCINTDGSSRQIPSYQDLLACLVSYGFNTLVDIPESALKMLTSISCNYENSESGPLDLVINVAESLAKNSTLVLNTIAHVLKKLSTVLNNQCDELEPSNDFTGLYIIFGIAGLAAFVGSYYGYKDCKKAPAAAPGYVALPGAAAGVVVPVAAAGGGAAGAAAAPVDPTSSSGAANRM
ncbi:MAG: hypothetical protein KIT27_02970 [Legionellales bacterium]|nr:hypothetical protein [Legionellales bacterium]